MMIMTKFRASMEPSWDLKIGILYYEFVEYLTRVSREYVTHAVSCD